MAANNVSQFRYRLCSDVPSDEMILEKVPLTKSWRPFFSRKDELNRFIRTKLNQDGLIEFEEFMPKTQEVIYSSRKFLDAPTKYYNEVDLEIIRKNRDFRKLAEIAETLGVSSINKKASVLITLILKAQQAYKDLKFSTSNVIDKPDDFDAEDEYEDEDEDEYEDSMFEAAVDEEMMGRSITRETAEMIVRDKMKKNKGRIRFLDEEDDFEDILDAIADAEDMPEVPDTRSPEEIARVKAVCDRIKAGSPGSQAKSKDKATSRRSSRRKKESTDEKTEEGKSN